MAARVARHLGLLLWALAAALSPAAAGAAPPAVVALAPLDWHGPSAQAGEAPRLAAALSRRLAEAGIPVKSLPGEADPAAARRLGATHLLSGSLNALGPARFAEMHLAALDSGAVFPLSAEAEAGAGSADRLAAALAGAVREAVAAPDRVLKVRVTGNRRIDAEVVLGAVKTRPGAPFSPKALSADLKAVFALGYFDDVRVEDEPGPKGHLVTFVVKEKPAIRSILFTGNKALKDKDLKAVLDLKPFTVVQEKALRENADKIEALYLTKGYVRTAVKPVVVKVSDRSADVRFEIEEGERILVKRIEIDGNEAFPDDTLKDLMETKEKGPRWLPTWRNIKALFGEEEAVLRWDTLERDAGRINAYYRNHGFIDARVGKPRVRQEGKWLYVTIPVEEGRRYRVGEVRIEESHFHDTSKILDRLETQRQEYFSQEVLRKDILTLTDIYADEGFASAEVDPRFQKDPAKGTVDITFHVETGPKVHFGRIEITGNTRTRDKVIRRELRVTELEPFTATGLRKSTDRLRRLGYFDDVDLTPSQGAREDVLDLAVKVKERLTGTFSVGAGYSSVDRLVFMADITQRNLFGRGQSLSFKGQLGSVSNRYTLSFTEPYFLDTRLSAGIDLYNWESDYDDYTRKSTGGALRFGYPLTDNLGFFWGGRIDNTTLSDVYDTSSVVIRDSLDIHTTRAVNLGLSYDTRNDYYNPTRGWTNSVSVEYAGDVLGGDAAYFKTQAVLGFYHPIWKNLVGHVKTGAGYVTFGRTGRLPVYERFFLGGIDSVRGYKYGRISPTDPTTGEYIGGNRMFYAQLEAIFPLVKDMGLNGVVFFDTGAVWQHGEKNDLRDLRKSVGFGIRWLSPMGPIRLEWGFNIDKKPGDDPNNWEFRMGGAF